MRNFSTKAATFFTAVWVKAMEDLIFFRSCIHDGGKRAKRTLFETLDIGLKYCMEVEVIKKSRNKITN